MINEDFMMGVFDGITKNLPPLQEYLDFMFENNQVSLEGSRKEDDKVLPWDLLRYELFYPTRKDIVYTHSFYIELTCEAASISIVEFRDKRKSIANYLSSISGEKNMNELDKEEKTGGKRIAAISCVPENGHAAATYDLQVCGTIYLQHCAARGQFESKKNFGREDDLLVHKRKAFKKKIMRGMGRLHLLPLELQRTSVLNDKCSRKSHRYELKSAMVEQLE